MADLVSYALTTVADVKESLGIDAGNTSKDNLIKRKINQATEMIEAFCGLPYEHHFEETTYTNEEYDSSGTSQFSFAVRPVSSVTSFQVRSGSTNVNSWESIDTEQYFLDENAGILSLLFNQYGGYNRYKASYTAGFSTIPADLAEACVILASYLVENSQSGSAVKSKREGARSIDYFDTQGSESLMETLGLDDMLARYINYELA